MISTIRYVDLAKQYETERAELEPRIAECLATGQWIGSTRVEALESALAKCCGVARAVGVGSGTDALILVFEALGIGPGDEVITVPNSFVATTAAVVAVGATPVFVDVLDDRTMDPAAVRRAISAKTRALLPVHLGGRIAQMDELSKIAGEHGLLTIEDAAQAFGSTFQGTHAGAFGCAGCFSAHPLKNLNACGDAGFVVTSDEELAHRVSQLRNNGLADRDTVVRWGRVTRLDAVQATILQFRLERLDTVIEARRSNAARYAGLLDPRYVETPPVELADDGRFDTFHTFVVHVDRRDELRTWLLDHGIETSIHYPTPIHLQPAANGLGYGRGAFPVTERQAARILSLPIHQFLSAEDIDRVATTIQEFYRR